MNIAAPLPAATQAVTDRFARVAHIDGLRAIAVLGVVGFHAGVPGLSGGFAGVDVFFVISGYLIVNHIVRELSTDTFSFAQFYARRALRLFPPLILVVLVTTLAAALLLVSPYEWEWFGLSALTASLYVSNFYFLSKQGYFDIDAFEKPLLHTWSLSVEEQFYLVVPLLLIGCFTLAVRTKIDAYRILAIAAAVVFAGSLLGCILWTDPGDRNYAFYLMHWRAWEFAAGGAIGFLGQSTWSGGRRYLIDAAGFSGVALILASFFFIHDRSWFPGYLAIFPVAGTVLAIVAGFASSGALSTRLIALRPLVFIGLVSYGWYLWHWPMISLARMAQFGDPSLTRDVLMAALSFLLAITTYRLVERPARRLRERTDLAQSGRKIVAAGFMASLALAVFSGALGGFAYLWTLHNPALAATIDHFIAASTCPKTICAAARGQRGLLIGDSHSDRIERTLQRESQKLGASIGRARGRGLAVKASTADFSILFARWNAGERYRLADKLVGDLSANGKARILLIGPVPEFHYKAANCVLRAERYGIDWDFCAIPRQTVEQRRRVAVAELKRHAEKHANIRFIDPLDLFCDEKTCRPYEKGVLLHKDQDHLSAYGSDWLYYHFKEDFWWVMSGNSTLASTASQKDR